MKVWPVQLDESPVWLKKNILNQLSYCNWLVVFSHPSEKYEFVNWDDDIPKSDGKIKLMATKLTKRMVSNPINMGK